jgi:hypothetical protein
MSLRKTARIFSLYQILIRLFLINNILFSILGLIGSEDIYLKEDPKLFPYFQPTGIMLLINNIVFIISSILLFKSTFSNNNTGCAFIGNLIASGNILIDFCFNLLLSAIKKPNFNLRIINYRNFCLLFIFNYSFLFEIILHYFIHSYVENLLDQNFKILDFYFKIEENDKFVNNKNKNIDNKNITNTNTNTNSNINNNIDIDIDKDID